MTEFTELAITGRVATGGDPDWDEIRPGWNLAADQNPAAIAYIESADDICKVIKFANRGDLRVAGQGTGHGAVALGPLDETILIKTDRMRGIDIEAEAETARIEAGVLAAELGMSAQKHGMCSMPGSSPDVGVIGYTLGGGLSWLGRKYGFACNRVNAIELVTADGELSQVTRESNPDLFWALRGGGGGYAIVTALHLSLLPISEHDALFNLIGTTYGGDGQSTFALPDLRGRVPVHQGQGAGGSTYVLGQSGGAEEVTLTVQQIPQHAHPLTATNDTATQTNPGGQVLARYSQANIDPYLESTPGTVSLAQTSITPVGGSQPHSNLQPFLCMNYIISLFGIFPSPS